MEYLNKYKKHFIILGIILLTIFIIFYYFLIPKDKEEIVTMNNIIKDENTTQTTKYEEKIFVDVKGAVKKPGVYEFLKHDKVIDAINKAGGLNKNASTNNLNLSKKLSNEMVIYVFTTKEITTTTRNEVPCKCETIEINNCIEKNNTLTTTKPIEEKETTTTKIDNSNEISQDNKININTATKEELMTLSGIGESKANAIIEFRNKNGKFNNIEELKNISGIGESLFDKVKDFIKI